MLSSMIRGPIAGRERDSRLPRIRNATSIERHRRRDAATLWRVRVPLLILATLAVPAACASADRASLSPMRSVSGPSSVLTGSEITRAGAHTAYEIIERLRPSYLSRTRGASCQRAVYLDGIRQGGLDELRRIPAESVWQIRRLDALDATTYFGTGNCSGAIMVMTRVAR